MFLSIFNSRLEFKFFFLRQTKAKADLRWDSAVLVSSGEGEHHRGCDRAGLHQPEDWPRRFQPARCHLLHAPRHPLHHTRAHACHSGCKFTLHRAVSCLAVLQANSPVQLLLLDDSLLYRRTLKTQINTHAGTWNKCLWNNLLLFCATVLPRV